MASRRVAVAARTVATRTASTSSSTSTTAVVAAGATGSASSAFPPPPPERVLFAVGRAEAQRRAEEWLLGVAGAGPAAAASLKLRPIRLPWWAFAARAVVHDAAAFEAERRRRRRSDEHSGNHHTPSSFEARAAERAARANSERASVADFGEERLDSLLYAGSAVPRDLAEVVKAPLPSPGAQATRECQLRLSGEGAPEDAFALDTLAAAWAVGRVPLLDAAGPGRELKLMSVRRVLLPAWVATYRWGGISAVQGPLAGPEFRALVSGTTGAVDGTPHVTAFERRLVSGLGEAGKRGLQLIAESRVQVDVNLRAPLALLAGFGRNVIARVGPLGAAALVLAPLVARRAYPIVHHAWQEITWSRQHSAELSAAQDDLPGWRQGDFIGTEWELYDTAPDVPSGARPGDEAYDEGRAVDWSDPRSVLGLGVGDAVTDAVLRKALRRELLRWHPDHNTDDTEFAEERTRRILDAFERLKAQRDM